MSPRLFASTASTELPPPGAAVESATRRCTACLAGACAPAHPPVPSWAASHDGGAPPGVRAPKRASLWVARSLCLNYIPSLCCAAFSQAATPAATLPARNEDTTVVVLGPTGYIGRFVTKELIRRGYKVGLLAQRRARARARAWLTLHRCSPQVVAFSRERSGVGGKKSKDDVTSDFQGAHKVVFGDVKARASLLVGGPALPELTPPRAWDAHTTRTWTVCATPPLLTRWMWLSHVWPAGRGASRCVSVRGLDCRWELHLTGDAP
jgi:hypothetical protein